MRCERLLAIELCEEIEQFVHEASLHWWNHGVSEESLRTYSFLARRNIPSRLDTIHFQTWKENIHNMLQRIPEELEYDDINRIWDDRYFDSIEHRLSDYEQAQEVAPILELALWKSKMEEQLISKGLDAEMKLQFYLYSLSMVCIIIRKALSFL